MLAGQEVETGAVSLQLHTAEVWYCFFLETLNKVILRSVDWKVKCAGFEGLCNFTNGHIWFAGARFLNIFELRGRLLERRLLDSGRLLE